MIVVDEVDTGTIVLFLLVPILFMLLVIGGMGFLLRRLGFEPVTIEPADEDGGAWESHRPWWANPLVWLGVSAVLLILGLFVAPHFIGGTFLFLPFLWMGGLRRRRPVARRSCPNCGLGLRPSDQFCPRCGAKVA